MNADAGDERRPSGSGVNVCAEFLSVYVDEHMKRLFRDLPDAEVEARLNKVITLFRFLRDKDVFEEHYKHHLTVRCWNILFIVVASVMESILWLLKKRLLGNRASSEDFEKLMLSKLKAECGFQYTSKLEGTLCFYMCLPRLSKGRLDLGVFNYDLRFSPPPPLFQECLMI